MLISIIFSFRNEEKNLIELIERVTNSLSELDEVNYELIFVNDNAHARFDVASAIAAGKQASRSFVTEKITEMI